MDGTGYFASVETSAALKKIPLIRNFARVTLVDDNSTGVTFHPDKFILVNTPTQGYIAPYDAKAGEYVKPYTDMYANVADWGKNDYLFKYENVYDWGYMGEMPQTASIVPLASNPKATEEQIKAYVNDPNNWLNVGTYGTESSYKFGYMYERSLPSAVNTPTCVLVHGVLSDTEAHEAVGARWFKIEITDLEGNYVPIYRDVTYIMMIKNIAIVGTPGWPTAYEAYKNKSVGDVSTSTETATLSQISDGKGTTLWVEYIDYTSVEPDANNATILYKLFYQENASSPEEVLTGEVLEDESLAEPLPYVTLRVDHYDGIGHAITADEISGTPFSGQTPDGKGGWYQAVVPLTGKGSVMMKSCLHIEGLTKAGRGAKSIFRNVEYRVIPTQELTLAVDPTSITDGIGKNRLDIFAIDFQISVPSGNIFSVSVFENNQSQLFQLFRYGIQPFRHRQQKIFSDNTVSVLFGIVHIVLRCSSLHNVGIQRIDTARQTTASLDICLFANQNFCLTVFCYRQSGITTCRSSADYQNIRL